MGGTVYAESENYLVATFSSSIFRFVDDFEIRVDSIQKVIHIRSASRVGYGDAGVNRKRAELFKKIYYKKVSEAHQSLDATPKKTARISFGIKRMKQIITNPPAFCLRATPFGPVAALWSVYRHEPKICLILLSRPGISAKHALKKFFPDSTASSCPEINIVVDQIEAFLNGEDIRFSLDVVRLDLCSAFQQKVLRAEHAIPRNRVSTYGLIAKHVKNPNGARAVGTALATNPFPLVIPCHRAIRSDGALGGFQGGLKMKRTLLEMEGIAFCDAGHVANRDFFYEDQTSFKIYG